MKVKQGKSVSWVNQWRSIEETFSLISMWACALFNIMTKLHSPRFTFIPKTGVGLLNLGVSFYCVGKISKKTGKVHVVLFGKI